MRKPEHLRSFFCWVVTQSRYTLDYSHSIQVQCGDFNSIQVVWWFSFNPGTIWWFSLNTGTIWWAVGFVKAGVGKVLHGCKVLHDSKVVHDCRVVHGCKVVHDCKELHDCKVVRDCKVLHDCLSSVAWLLFDKDNSSVVNSKRKPWNVYELITFMFAVVISPGVQTRSSYLKTTCCSFVCHLV